MSVLQPKDNYQWVRGGGEGSEEGGRKGARGRRRGKGAWREKGQGGGRRG